MQRPGHHQQTMPRWGHGRQLQPQTPVLQTYSHQGAYSSHYAQAYLQSQYAAQPSTSCLQYPQVTSTTYNPTKNGPLPAQPTGSWHRAGDQRCTYKDCRFTGSPKALELHMMDRHLIFPPGWDKRQQKEEWLADPSLKGKPIPIQGTNVIFDSPETLEAWKEERRKRFPTANRVEEKKRKMDEAIARGQLTVEDMGVRPEKRRRTDDANNRLSGQSTRGNGRRGRGAAPQVSSRVQGRPVVHALPQRPSAQAAPPNENISPVVWNDDDGSSSEDSHGEPEVCTSKPPAPVPVTLLPGQEPEKPQEPPTVQTEKVQAPPKPRQERPPQPKRALQNPFDNRPPLLRNLILPEIRVTVSNLSQVIRFLVDNDFLKNVELKPGQAQETPIQVLSSHETPS